MVEAPVINTIKVVKTTDKQTEFAEAVFSGDYTRLLFGGGVGGGKTTGTLLIICALAKIYPGSRWVVVRQDRPTLRRNTLPSFWKTCPQPFFHPDRYNKSDMIATAINGSRIEFIPESYSEDPELKKFDGLEVNGFVLEEADELQVATYLKCIERSGRWIINPMPLPYILLTCNPHQGFLKEVFYTPWKKKELLPPYFFTRSLVGDNPHQNKEYIKNLQEIKKRAPALYRRLVEGSWEAEDSLQQLIGWDYLYDSQDRFYFDDDVDLEISLGVDVGRYGKDATVFTVLKGTHDVGYNIEKQVSIDKTSIPETAKMTKDFINKYIIPHDRVFVDVVGLGGGVYDILEEEGYYVQQIIGGSKPIEQITDGGFKFKDLNAQIGWNIKMYIEEGKLGGLIDDELRSDLGAQGYDIIGDKAIRLWSKDVLKKILNRSPDKGDSFKYAYWGQIYDYIQPMPGFEIL